MKIILASRSPRRQELLRSLGLTFTVVIPDVDETYPDDMSLRMVPAYLSEKKAQAFSRDLEEDELLLAADTLVILHNRLYEKPADEEDAKRMLRDLSGNMHEVVTGVTLKTKEKIHTFSELTRVYFRPLSEEMIDYYVKEFRPLDKAGAYGIQDFMGYVAIEKVNGCFYNVMGLPVSRLIKELERFHYRFPRAIR